MSSTGVTDADVTTARDCAATRETANWVSAKASAGTVITSEGIPMNEQPKRRVALIGTGGTISSMGRDSLDVWEYMDTGQRIGPDDLVARYPEMSRIVAALPRNPMAQRDTLP